MNEDVFPIDYLNMGIFQCHVSFHGCRGRLLPSLIQWGPRRTVGYAKNNWGDEVVGFTQVISNLIYNGNATNCRVLFHSRNSCKLTCAPPKFNGSLLKSNGYLNTSLSFCIFNCHGL